MDHNPKVYIFLEKNLAKNYYKDYPEYSKIDPMFLENGMFAGSVFVIMHNFEGDIFNAEGYIKPEVHKLSNLSYSPFKKLYREDV